LNAGGDVASAPSGGETNMLEAEIKSLMEELAKTMAKNKKIEATRTSSRCTPKEH
jgi:hypothetical protein